MATGYDSDEVKHLVEEEQRGYEEALAALSQLLGAPGPSLEQIRQLREMQQQTAQCCICHKLLLPDDDDHHVGIDLAVNILAHFCGQHCPSCGPHADEG